MRFSKRFIKKISIKGPIKKSIKKVNKSSSKYSKSEYPYGGTVAFLGKAYVNKKDRHNYNKSFYTHNGKLLKKGFNSSKRLKKLRNKNIRETTSGAGKKYTFTNFIMKDKKSADNFLKKCKSLVKKDSFIKSCRVYKNKN